MFTFQQRPSSGLVLRLLASTARAFSFLSKWSAPFAVSSVGRWGHERCRRHRTREGGARRGSSSCADRMRGRKRRAAAWRRPRGSFLVQPRSRSRPPLFSKDLKRRPGERKLECRRYTGFVCLISSPIIECLLAKLLISSYYTFYTSLRLSLNGCI